MNYYNPYFFTDPFIANTTRTSLFSRLFNGLSFGKILNGTQRALTFANQAIPFIKQVKPIVGNAKTMFKIMNEFKRSEKSNQNIYRKNNNIKKYNNNIINNDDGPTFFI